MPDIPSSALCSHTAVWAPSVGHTQGRQTATDQNCSPVFLQSGGPVLGKLSPRMSAAAETLGVLTEHMPPERLYGVRLYLTDEAMDPHREHQEALPANLCLCSRLQITHGSIFVTVWF